MSAPATRRWPVLLPAGLAVIALALLPMALSPFHVRVLQLFFFAAGLALSWNLLGGFAGYWSFGHTVFVGTGAFTAGLLSARLTGAAGGAWSMLVPVAAGGIVSALLALLIAYPILRLRGIYFAIAMLGVSQVTGELANNLDWIGGGLGLMLPAVAPETMEPERFFYYIFLAMLVVILAVAAGIRASRLGYGLLSIREDEDAARMLGVPTERYKTAAFVIGAFLVGVSGAFYAYSLGYFTTSSVFRIDFSLNMIVYTLIGGIGTLAGPLIGTAVMLFLTQIVLGSLLDIHLMITGAVVVLIVLLAPGGILGVGRRLAARRAAGEPERP